MRCASSPTYSYMCVCALLVKRIVIHFSTGRRQKYEHILCITHTYTRSGQNAFGHVHSELFRYFALESGVCVCVRAYASHMRFVARDGELLWPMLSYFQCQNKFSFRISNVFNCFGTEFVTRHQFDPSNRPIKSNRFRRYVDDQLLLLLAR